MFFDPTYLLLVFIPATIISLAAQWYVRSNFDKWSKVRNSTGLTGNEVARRIISRAGLGSVEMHQPQVQQGRMAPAAAGISLERTAGAFSDHFDPRTNTVRLSDATANQPSVAAMAVVAHELGHAQQHQENSIFMQMRNFLVPAIQFSPQLAMILIFVGLFLRITGALWLGIGLFGLMVLFALLTLPVEFDASRRGLILLNETGLMQDEDDRTGSRAVLTAAGLTYVAAAITAVLQLLYFVSLAQRRR